MWRRVGLLACYSVGWSAAHPLCYVQDKPTDLDKTESTFCPRQQDGGGVFIQVGSCCTDEEEAVIKAKFEETPNLTDECSVMYKQVMCGTCHSFSAHLYEKLGAELGQWDGMTMKRDFCTKLTEVCSEIDFPDYDGGISYCDKHVGSSNGNDNYWSYPYTEDEIFEGGYSEVMPDADLPRKAYSMKLSPGGSMYWISGIGGELKKVMASDMKSSSTVMDVSECDDFYVHYEEGFLDFAFDPNFEDNHFFYVSYTVNRGNNKGQQNRLSKFVYWAGHEDETRKSEVVLIDSAEKDGNIHSGGWVGFKPSTYGKGNLWNDLYWTTGDGGLQTDPHNNSQKVDGFLGAVVRISVPSDPDIDKLYKIPDGNYHERDPKAAPELCANGFRNLWKCSFDRETDELYCGDVGHTMVEEIDIVECGKNYGWSRFEGSRCQSAMEDRDGPCDGADRETFEFPIFEYCHPDYHSDNADEQVNLGGKDICGDRELTGLSVIGGFVYRGTKLADLLYGAYVFADWSSRGVYYIKKDADDAWKSGTIVSDRSVRVAGFTEDLDGELMILTGNKVYNLPCGDLCGEPVPTFSVPEEEYLGCFKDVEEDRLFTFTYESTSDMKASVCKEICAGSDLYGIQYSRECWCRKEGNPTDYDRHGTATCNMACTGIFSEKCGGSWSMSIYRSDGWESPTPPAGSSYLGCFRDKEERVFPHKVDTSEAMSASVCEAECDGYSYYGLQYGKQCWCGDDGADYDKHGESTGCSWPCTGNGDETCGGYWSMDVYHIQDMPSPTPPTPTPTAPTPPTHLGCFADTEDQRIFAVHAASANKMSSTRCKSVCTGYSYYGMQHKKECWCGESDADYGRHGTSTGCIAQCLGGNGETCGGAHAMDVYRIGDSAPSPTPPTPTPPTPTPPTDSTPSGYLGCFTDREDERIFTLQAAYANKMSASRCRSACTGYRYYGMQHKKECWCGESGADYDKHGGSTGCIVLCRGGEGETCGGAHAMDIYLMD